MIPYREHKRLAALAEDTEDIRAFDEARASDEDMIPSETVHRLIERENPIKVWREYRGLTQMQLAEAAGVRPSYIAMLERGERQAQWLSYA